MSSATNHLRKLAPMKKPIVIKELQEGASSLAERQKHIHLQKMAGPQWNTLATVSPTTKSMTRKWKASTGRRVLRRGVKLKLYKNPKGLRGSLRWATTRNTWATRGLKNSTARTRTTVRTSTIAQILLGHPTEGPMVPATNVARWDTYGLSAKVNQTSILFVMEVF